VKHDELGNDAGDTGTAVDKALSILELVAWTPTPLTLAAIAERWSMPKPTAHRLVQTLVRRGYIRQDSDRTYMAGPRTLELGQLARVRFSYARVARPMLSGLQRRTGHTVQLGTADDFEVRCVDQVDGSGALRMAPQIGEVLDLHTTAIGKAVLAFAEPNSREEFLARGAFAKKTSNTITTRPALRRRLDLVLEQGYAVDNEEDQLHVFSVGAPVFSDQHRFALGGVGISAPAFEMSRADVGAVAPLIMATACAISVALGAPVKSLPIAHQAYA
jgi:IclR family transcriptional regulator, acetate operon repressor